MEQYHKIQTVYKRNPSDNFKTLLEGQYSIPEFELLKDIEWVWTEKIDGTNIRIIWDGYTVRFGGKTDKAQLPAFLLQNLHDMFTVDKMKKAFPEEGVVCLYGEGYGAKIQKGGNYLPDKTSFILFDVNVGPWLLTRKSVREVAERLEINTVPVVGRGNLNNAVEFCRKGFKSTIAHNKNYDAEGLVLRPEVELFDRGGKRIITKIKSKDF